MARVKLTDEERKQRQRERDKCHYEKTKSNKKEYSKQYYSSNKEERTAYMRQWNLNNKDRANSYRNQRRQSNPVIKLKCQLYAAICNALYKRGYTKRSRTVDVLGCTWEQFKQYIEAQFEPWMHWGNTGGKTVVGPNTTWDLDHIIPISTAVTEDDVKRLNHYTNFQPLCSYVNRFVKRDSTMF